MSLTKPIYLDYNATTPLTPEVVRAMRPFLERHFGNPSSSHSFGRIAYQAVESARRQVANLVHAQPEEIVFTSGGTESNNLALRGAAIACRKKGSHIITTAVEHPAVTEVCLHLATLGFQITTLPVDGYGRVSPEELLSVMRPDTILVSIMHANNEVGTIQPIQQLSKIAHQYGALFHTDAAQSIGKIPVDVDKLGVDLLSIAGHKLYAPKGIGALYIRKDVHLEKVLFGAGQEQGRRPGTENVFEIVGLGKAAQQAKSGIKTNNAHLIDMRDRLYHGLAVRLPADKIRLNGHPEARLPNTLNLSFKGIEANILLDLIQDHVAASAGAACHAGQVQISGVLIAMGVPLEWAKGAVRFSVGCMTTEKEIDRAVEVITAAVTDLWV